MIATTKAADAELVVLIVEALKPWCPQWRQIETGYATEIPAREVEHMITDYVQQRIDSLRVTTRDFFSRDAVINKRQAARDVILTIDRLKHQLLNAPPELRLRFKTDLPPHFDQHVTQLFAALDHIHCECEKAINSAVKKGASGRRDEVKLWCARTAHLLMHKFSNEKPTSGSANAPYRVIAGLVYRAIVQSEADPPDLKRACDTILKSFRRSVQIEVQKSPDL
jgi:hypothetical protein